MVNKDDINFLPFFEIFLIKPRTHRAAPDFIFPPQDLQKHRNIIVLRIHRDRSKPFNDKPFNDKHI